MRVYSQDSTGWDRGAPIPMYKVEGLIREWFDHDNRFLQNHALDLLHTRWAPCRLMSRRCKSVLSVARRALHRCKGGPAHVGTWVASVQMPSWHLQEDPCTGANAFLDDSAGCLHACKWVAAMSRTCLAPVQMRSGLQRESICVEAKVVRRLEVLAPRREWRECALSRQDPKRLDRFHTSGRTM
jgi:hypothetical protein